ncbi:MAG: 2-C-methyl-D-erythritol 4-phosphate cytidylyltransferase [Eubacterium sp.]|nr:2-C-methyl-D-erythritol 4-phosphate cytidylyltransferase [Eubacterium sp.]
MNIAIVLSGGVGSRVGTDVPKQYIVVGGRMIISWCLETLFRDTEIDGVLIVADPEKWQARVAAEMKELFSEEQRKKFLGFAAPGKNRQLSIYHALLHLKKLDCTDDEDRVLIHDAARPFLTHMLIHQCFSALSDADGVMPVLPMKDTVYFCTKKGEVDSLLPRDRIFAGQAPEAFRFGKYLQANEKLLPVDILAISGSTEPAIRAGLHVRTIPGDDRNFKITTPEDLERFRESVRGRNEDCHDID